MRAASRRLACSTRVFLGSSEEASLATSGLSAAPLDRGASPSRRRSRRKRADAACASCTVHRGYGSERRRLAPAQIANAPPNAFASRASPADAAPELSSLAGGSRGSGGEARAFASPSRRRPGRSSSHGRTRPAEARPTVVPWASPSRRRRGRPSSHGRAHPAEARPTVVPWASPSRGGAADRLRWAGASRGVAADRRPWASASRGEGSESACFASERRRGQARNADHSRAHAAQAPASVLAAPAHLVDARPGGTRSCANLVDASADAPPCASDRRVGACRCAPIRGRLSRMRAPMRPHSQANLIHARPLRGPFANEPRRCGHERSLFANEFPRVASPGAKSPHRWRQSGTFDLTPAINSARGGAATRAARRPSRRGR
jgi:hypothetical protein